MADYITYLELEQRISQDQLIQLTNDENRAIGEINLESAEDACRKRIDQAIKEAGTRIDSFLNTRITLPLTTISEAVKDISRDLAAYNLWTRRPMEVPESVTDRNKYALASLKNFQSGIESLGLSAAQESESETGFYVTNKTDDDREYDATKWSGYP